jgi:hypothetical protein
MPDPVTGVIAGTSVIGAGLQSRSASRATRAQQQAADQSLAEQRRQFDAMQGLLRPYVNAGGPALAGLMDLAGLSPVTTNWTAFAQSNPELMAAYQAQQQQFTGGQPAGAGYGIADLQGGLGTPYFNERFGMGDFVQDVNVGAWNGNNFGTPYVPQGLGGNQGGPQPVSLEQFAQQWAQQNGADVSQFQNNPQAQAVARIEGQPMFQALARQGEEAILQNASATGGLRGGNTQGALARFRPQLLNQFIEQQYGRLAGITTLGQNAAAGVGSAGMQTGVNIGNILQNAGMAQAAGAGAQGQIFGNLAGSLGGILAGAIRPSGPQASLVGSVNNAMQQNPGLF